MVLTLNGIPTDLPLYDLQGNPVYKPESAFEDIIATSDDLTSRVSALVDEIDLDGIEVEVGSDVLAYDYNIEDETEGEYYAVNLYIQGDDSGSWSKYLKALSELMNMLEQMFEDSWIRNINLNTEDNSVNVEVAILL